MYVQSMLSTFMKGIKKQPVYLNDMKYSTEEILSHFTSEAVAVVELLDQCCHLVRRDRNCSADLGFHSYFDWFQNKTHQ